MSVSVTLNGTSYTIPQSGETGWGSAVTSWIQAVSNSTLQKTGGSFILTADVDFGATYGVKASSFKSRNANPSATGIVRLSNDETVAWRNAANSADLALKVNAANQLEFAGNPITGATALTANKAVVTGASGVLTTSAASDTEISYLVGVSSAIQTQLNSKITAAAGNIVNADVNASAAIARTKLASGSNNHVLINDGSGVMSSEATLAKSRGGSGQDNSSLTFPATGTLATLAGSETLTNKTLTSPAITTPTGIVKGDVGLGNVDNTSDATKNAAAVTLTNKTLTTPVIDVIQATDQGSTPATPAAGTTKIYSKTDGKVYKLTSLGTEVEIGTGSGGGINYVSNPDFEAATTGYAAYADAAGASPVDGTGGSPTVTITRSTSSPLRGVASGVITKDAANRQGEGVSYAFTIADADKAKVMSVSFDYAIASGTFVGGTDSAVGDLVLYVYDVTNAVLIQPSSYKVLGSVSGQFYKHQATFQTNSNSSSYRLIWHVATTSASAWTFKFDNVQLGPQAVLFGAPITDWETYTPTGTWSTNCTYTGRRRRVGDTLESWIQILLTGAPTSATLGVNLPTGLSIDTTKWDSDGDNFATLGNAYLKSAGADYMGSLRASGTTAIQVASWAVTSPRVGVALVTQAAPATFANGDEVHIIYRVPIAGWGSSVVMSNDTDTRLVGASTGRSGTQTGVNPNATYVKIQLNVDTGGQSYDSHDAFDTTNNRFVAPMPGKYFVTGAIEVASTNVLNNNYQATIGVNGTPTILGPFTRPAATTPITVGVSAVLNLNAGDYVELFLYGAGNNSASTLTVNSGSGSTYMDLFRLAAPSAIAASEKVAASAYLSGNQTGINTNNTTVKIVYNSVTPSNGVGFDSHSAFNTTLGRFVAPRNDKYRISALAEFASTNVLNNSYQLQIFVNGTYARAGAFIRPAATTTFAISVNGLVNLRAGDYAEIFVFGAGNNSASTLTADTITYFEIESI